MLICVIVTSINWMASLKAIKINSHQDINRKVIYKIQCRDCDETYVGQTGRLLKTRIKKHINHINRKTSCEYVITQIGTQA